MHVFERNRNMREVNIIGESREKRPIAPTETIAPRRSLPTVAGSFQLAFSDLPFVFYRLWGREIQNGTGFPPRACSFPRPSFTTYLASLQATAYTLVTRPLFSSWLGRVAGSTWTPVLIGGGWGPFSLKAGDLRRGR